MRKKIVYIISKLEKSLEYEWLATYLDSTKYELVFILLNDHKTEFEKFLEINQNTFLRINYSGKKQFFKALNATRKALKKIDPDIINCNLLDANVIGLTAGKLAGIKRRIYTRHHSDFNFKYSPKGIYYDKWSNYLATEIVAISENVKEILTEKEGVNPRKVTVIPYGFSFDEYDSVTEDRVTKIKDKYGIGLSSPIIGVVSRYVKWKGIPFIIRGFAELLTDYPNAKLVLANAGHGDDEENIRKLLQDLCPDNFVEIDFENDIAALFKAFDVFVHVPVDRYVEAFGRIYIEALASKTPSIFTISGIANDFVIDGENARVVKYEDGDSIYQAMTTILTTKSEEMVINAYNDVKTKFSINKHIELLEEFYDRE
ncbi:MAG: glycosyltransferase family 4 protein [Flavobacteriales bacterium]|nr:glycosyltransferase family 4 protein [Flavobacteriales bacterium]